VISAPYDSPYDHPHDEPLERLAARDVTTYWTAIHGTVVFTSDGDAVQVATQTEATTDPAEFDDAEPSDADPTDPVEERGTTAPSLGGPAAPIGQIAGWCEKTARTERSQSSASGDAPSISGRVTSRSVSSPSMS